MLTSFTINIHKSLSIATIHINAGTTFRWDINSLDSLPEYMKICFLALFNSVNELAYHILREQGFNVISNMRNLVKTFVYTQQNFHV